MNKEVFNPKFRTPDFSSFPIQDIAPVVDSLSNIINSVSCIVESNNKREVSLANVYANHDLEMKKLEIAHADYLASLGLSREEFHLVLNNQNISEELRERLLIQIIEKQKCFME